MSKKESAANYESPQIEIIEVKIEKGFAATSNEDYLDREW